MYIRRVLTKFLLPFWRKRLRHNVFYRDGIRRLRRFLTAEGSFKGPQNEICTVDPSLLYRMGTR